MAASCAVHFYRPGTSFIARWALGPDQIIAQKTTSLVSCCPAYCGLCARGFRVNGVIRTRVVVTLAAGVIRE